MLELFIWSDRTTAIPVNVELATVISCVVPWNVNPVTASPSTRMLEEPLKLSPIDTLAPGCAVIVTVEDFEPDPVNVP